MTLTQNLSERLSAMYTIRSTHELPPICKRQTLTNVVRVNAHEKLVELFTSLRHRISAARTISFT
jgi:hypothetical protein